MMATLEQAMTQLYEVFARYSADPGMEHCDHCISDQEVQDLVSKPLRELTAEDLGSYSGDAIHLWGSPTDFKHFLPRLLELAIRDPAFLTDQEVIFGKLRHGDWLTWPAGEVAAVRTYLHLLWAKTLAEVDPVINVDTALCSIGQAETDLKPYLDVWQESKSVATARNLAVFIEENLPSLLKKSELGNAFWKDRETQAKQVRDWLRSLAVRRKLETMAVENSESPEAEILMATAERLQVFDTRLGDA